MRKSLSVRLARFAVIAASLMAAASVVSSGRFGGAVHAGLAILALAFFLAVLGGWSAAVARWRLSTEDELASAVGFVFLSIAIGAGVRIGHHLSWDAIYAPLALIVAVLYLGRVGMSLRSRSKR